MYSLYHRHFLRLINYNSSEIKHLINLSSSLKTKKNKNNEIKYLKRKNIVLIFEKESTRTRCSAEIAAWDQGARVTYLGPGNTHMGYKESIEDTANILGQLYHGILYRGCSHQTIQTLSKHAGIPVWNGLTEKFHPTQILADLLTMKESFNEEKSFSKISCAYIGDTRNNISNSILEAAALLGMNLRLVGPKKYWPNKDFLKQCQIKAKKSNGTILCTENIQKGVEYVDFLYTDVWLSMGESEKNWTTRIRSLKEYQINTEMLSLTKNPKVKILHCLPAFHDNKTIIGKKIAYIYKFTKGLEITDEVFKSKNSIILNQSKNRIHVIKALMLATLCKKYDY